MLEIADGKFTSDGKIDLVFESSRGRKNCALWLDSHAEQELIYSKNWFYMKIYADLSILNEHRGRSVYIKILM